MGQPPNERDRGADEDLFEDLDQFFAPLEGGDWPEEQTPAPPLPSDEPLAADGDLDDIEGLAIDPPDEDDMADPESPERPAPSAGPPAEDEGFEFFEEETPAARPPAPPGEWVDEATAEMEGADWDTIRASSAEPTTPPAPSEPGAEEATPLSIDDLKAAPPEYSALPGPPDAEASEEPVLEEEATIGSLEDLEEIEEPAPPPPGEPAPPEFETAPITFGETEAPEATPVEMGPPAEGVEAAADHFASGMRESPEEVERELLADLERPGVQSVQIDPAQAAEAAPAWEEGGAQTVEPEAPEEPSPAGGRRNLPAAFISGIILAAAAIALLAVGEGPFAVLAIVVILLGQAEFYAVMRSRGHRPATLLGLVAGAFILAGAYLKGEAAVLLGLFIAMAATGLWYMAAPAPQRKGIVTNAGTTLVGVVYVPFMASFALLLLRFHPTRGATIFLTVIGLTVLYDVAAFAVGSWFGSRPLAPTVSPSKSWEGAIGATFVVLLVGIAVIPSLAPFDPPSAVGLALVIALVAPIGDLVESAFKRDLDVKDMSGLLPGHGGMLDRIDAILFTAPAAFYFLRIFL